MVIVDPTFRRAAYDQHATITPILLLTLEHPSFASTLRFTSERIAVLSRGNTYQAIGMGTSGIPNSVPGEIPTATLTLGDMDGSISQVILAATGEKIAVTVEIVGSHDLDVVQFRAFLNIDAAQTDVTGQLQLALSATEVLDEPFPAYRMTPSNFPNLFANELASGGV